MRVGVFGSASVREETILRVGDFVAVGVLSFFGEGVTVRVRVRVAVRITVLVADLIAVFVSDFVGVAVLLAVTV